MSSFSEEQKRQILQQARDNIERLKDGPARPFARWNWGRPEPKEDELGPIELPPAPPRTAKQDEWNRDSEERAAAQRAETIRRHNEERADRIERTRAYYQDELVELLEQRLADMVTVERAYLSEILTGVVREVTKGVVDDLEQLRDELTSQISDLRGDLDQLRAEFDQFNDAMNELRVFDKAKVIDLPNPLRTLLASWARFPLTPKAELASLARPDGT